MTQLLVPSADVQNPGSWTTAPLWSKVNDPSDTGTPPASYIGKANNSTGACRLGPLVSSLGTLQDPGVHTGHILHIYCMRTGTRATTIAVTLYEGTTSRATFNAAPTSATYTHFSYTLTAAEAGALTNYANLNIDVNCTASGSGNAPRVSCVWLEVPGNSLINTKNNKSGFLQGGGTEKSNEPGYLDGVLPSAKGSKSAYTSNYPIPIIDNFNGSLSNWTFTGGTYTLSGGKLICPTSVSAYCLNNTSRGVDQAAGITLSTLQSDGGEVGIVLKSDTYTGAPVTALRIGYNHLLGTVQCDRITAGSPVTLPSGSFSATFANGDILWAQAYTSGVLKVYKNYTLLATINCSSFTGNLAGGYVGIWTNVGITAYQFDDFGQKNYSSFKSNKSAFLQGSAGAQTGKSNKSAYLHGNPGSPMLLDDFNRANENPLNTDVWACPLWPSDENLRVISNQAVGGTDWSGGYWKDSFSADQAVGATFIGGSALELCFRIANPNQSSLTCYYLSIDANGTCHFYIVNGVGSETAIGPEATVPSYHVGTPFRVYAIGNKLTAQYNSGSGWTTLIETTDNTFSNAGYIGMDITSDAQFDDFWGGPIAFTKSNKSVFTRGANCPSRLLDDFNRANSFPIDPGNWGRVDPANGYLNISNQAVVPDGFTWGTGYWKAWLAQDQEVYCTMGGSYGTELYLRLQDPGATRTAYFLEYYLLPTPRIGFYTLDWDTETPIGSVYIVTLAAGNRIRATAIGNVLTAYIDTGSGWQQVLQTVDNTYIRAGYIGLGITGTADTFGGGEVYDNHKPAYLKGGRTVRGTSYFDDFDHVAGNLIAPWADSLAGYSWIKYDGNGNVVGDSSSGDNCVYWNSGPFRNQFVEYDVVAFGDEISAIFRLTTTNPSFYSVSYGTRNSTLQFYVCDANGTSWTDLHLFGAYTLNVGDRVRIELHGYTFTIYVNGIQVGSWTDPNTLYASGYVGLDFYGNVGKVGSWFGGSLTGHPAYLNGATSGTPVSSNKPGYLKGRSSQIANKSVYLSGQSSQIANQPAFLHGQDDAPHRVRDDFNHAETPLETPPWVVCHGDPWYWGNHVTDINVGQGKMYHAGKVLGPDQRVSARVAHADYEVYMAVTARATGTGDDLTAYAFYVSGAGSPATIVIGWNNGVAGWGAYLTTQSFVNIAQGDLITLVVTGQDPNIRLQAYINGTLVIDLPQSEFLDPTAILPSGYPGLYLHLQGNSALDDFEAVELIGQYAPAYLRGSTSGIANQPAYLEGTSAGVDTQSSTQAFTQGSTQESGSNPAYLKGHVIIDYAHPSNPILDDFNRADGNVGSNWYESQAGTQIINQEARIVTNINPNVIWNVQEFYRDQEAYFRITDLHTTNDDSITLVVRYQADGVHLLCLYRHSQQQITVYRVWNNDYNNYTQYAASLHVGDLFRCRVRGNILYAYQNNVELFQTDVSNWQGTDLSTHIGFRWFCNPSNTQGLDDFGGGVLPRIWQPAYLTGVAPVTSNSPAYLYGQDTTKANQAAYLKGHDHAKHSKAVYLSGQLGTLSARSGYNRGQLSIWGNIFGYLVGSLVVLDTTGAYTAGSAEGKSACPAYLEGEAGLPASARAAYTHGQATGTDSQAAYSCGGLASQAQQVAYLEGSINSLSSSYGFLRGNASHFSNLLVYLKGWADQTASSPAYLRSEATSASSLPAYANGQSEAFSSKSAYIIGNPSGTPSSSASVYIKGKQATSGHAPAYALGGLEETGSHPAYLVASSSSSSRVAGYIVGGSNILASQAGFIVGSSQAASSSPAVLTGSQPATSSSPSYVYGNSTTTSARGVFLRGAQAGLSHVTTYLVAQGHAAGAQPAYLCGQVTSHKNAFTQGVPPVNFYSSHKPAYVKGIASTRSQKYSYTRGRLTTLDSRHGFLSGRTGSTGHLSAYLKGRTNAQTSHSGFLTGGIPVRSSHPAVTAGSAGARSNSRGYTKGSQSGVSSRHVYICGSLGAHTAAPAYLRGRATSGSAVPVFLTGTAILSQDTRQAYLSGQATSEAHAQASLRGASSTRWSVPAFLVGGVASHKPAFLVGKSRSYIPLSGTFENQYSLNGTYEVQKVLEGEYNFLYNQEGEHTSQVSLAGEAYPRKILSGTY